MNTHHARALVADRQADLYRHAADRRAARVAAPHGGIRRRLGMLLVEAGLHLITGAPREDRVVLSAPIAH